MLKIRNSRNTFMYPTLDAYRARLCGMRATAQRIEALGTSTEQIMAVTEVDDGTGGVALARIVHGRWVADCPQPGCTGAMDVTPGEPAFCTSCLNIGIGFRWRQVLFPVDVAGIEAALSLRLLPETANWTPIESVDDLLVENVVHGVEVIA